MTAYSPQVSVIIPNYNHARYLEKRFESVLNQTFQDFEILYLDDASTDDSAQVFARYAEDPRVRTILNEKNGGSAFKQWDKGVDAAQGRYIWIAEADDAADSHLLETLVSLLDENPDVGLAFCRSQIVDENDRLLDPPNPDEYADDPIWNASFVMTGEEYLRRYMIHANTIPNASALLFRKAIYQAAGGACREFKLAGDWLTYFAMLKHSGIAYVPQRMNFFRTHATTVRNSSVKGGLWVEERYQASRYIAQHFDLPAAELEKMRHKCMEIWQRAIYDHETRIGWQRGWRIFRLARRFDSRAAFRFVRHTLYRALHQTPLFEIARQAGRALWGAIASARP